MEDFLKIFANYSQQDLLLQGMNTGKNHNVGFKQLEECCCHFFLDGKGVGEEYFRVSKSKSLGLSFLSLRYLLDIQLRILNTWMDR